MKTKWTVLGFCLFASITIGLGLIIAHRKAPAVQVESKQTFQVNGLIRSLDADGNTVTIEHEDIPDFMPSMTMPFTVKDPALLRGLRAGDRVRFELVVTADDSWISAIAKRSGSTETTTDRTPPIAAQHATEESKLLENGQTVPNFTLTNQNGQAFELNDYRGQVVLITFMFARCPLPNYCPLMSKNFADLQARLSREFPGQFHLITISFDPEHDTPELLKRYAASYTRDESSWTFATGSPEQIAAVASEFGLVYLPEAGSFTHDLRTALVAPDGQLIHVWRSNVWTPYEVDRRVAEVLRPEKSTPGFTSNVWPRSSLNPDVTKSGWTSPGRTAPL